MTRIAPLVFSAALAAALALVVVRGPGPGPAQAADPAVLELRSRILRLEADVRARTTQPAAPGVTVLEQRVSTLELAVAGLREEVEDLKAKR